MEYVLSLLLSPAAVAAVVAAFYWIYPSPLVQGYNMFGGYIMAGLKRRFIEVGDISYCYYEREAIVKETSTTMVNSHDPRKTILFIHGLTGNKTMWTLMVNHLPKEWRLILIDLPGHGETTFKPDGGYCGMGLAQKLKEFIEAMDLQNLHLVGCSLGSLVSAAYASENSQSIESLTLMCPPFAHKLPEGVKTQFMELLESGHNKVMPTDAKEFQEMMELVLYYPERFTFHSRMREALVNAQIHLYPYFSEIQQNLMDHQESAEYIERMAGNISVPVHILWGEHDKVCHPSGASILSKLVKDCQVTIVDKCGHAMSLDRPRKCAKLVQEFITGVAH